MIPINLPPQFAEKMESLLAGEWPSFRAGLDGGRLYGLRANTLKIAPSSLASILKDSVNDIGLSPVPWCAEGFYHNEAARPAKSPLYNAGLYYLQEPSAMLPAAVAEIEPGMRVLGLCAAPGGKSTAAAARLAGAGVLVSNDVSASRCGALVKNIELSGCRNAVVTNETPEKLAFRFAGWFDRILIDAPCSGEGMFRKDPDAAKSWEARKPAACAEIQRKILGAAAQMLKPGGVIVYSTCTFDPVEDEMMMGEFLDGHGDFGIWPLDAAGLGISPGRPEWGGGRADLAGCGRIWPHVSAGEGHFVCRLKKNTAVNYEEDDAGHMRRNGQKKPAVGKKPVDKYALQEGLDLFWKFAKDNLMLPEDFFAGYDFERRANAFYAAPKGLPPFDGLRVCRSGWYLGDVKTGRFEPSQALAMGLTRETANCAAIEPGDERIGRYLKGESFDFPCRDGWATVCIGEYPLGWAKASGGRLKNKLARGWTV